MGKKSKSKTGSSESVASTRSIPLAEKKHSAISLSSQGLASGVCHVPVHQGSLHLKPGSPTTIKVAPDHNPRVVCGSLFQQGSPHMKPGSPAAIRSAPDPVTPFEHPFLLYQGSPVARYSRLTRDNTFSMLENV